MADVLGLLVITPALALAARSQLNASALSGKSLAMGTLLLAVSLLVFCQTSAPLLFIITPVSFAIGFHLGQSSIALTTLFLTTVSLVATHNNSGPVALMSDSQSRIWFIQIFCLVNHFTTWFVAAWVAELDTLKAKNVGLAEADACSKRRLSLALNIVRQGLCIFDAEKRLVATNDSFLEMHRLRPEMVPVGITYDELSALGGLARLGPKEEENGGAISLETYEFDQTLVDGRVVNICQQQLGDGGVVCTYTDVTAERRVAGELRHASLHDPLTELGNRRYFNEAFTGENAGQSPCALLLIDVDHFKRINDSYGHTTGDELLKIVAGTLKECIRQGDELVRFGGDEFAVIARGVIDIAVLEQLSQRMLDTIRGGVSIGTERLPVSLSIGGGLSNSFDGPEQLFEAVDAALYAAKAAGRDQMQCAVPNIHLQREGIAA